MTDFKPSLRFVFRTMLVAGVAVAGCGDDGASQEFPPAAGRGGSAGSGTAGSAGTSAGSGGVHGGSGGEAGGDTPGAGGMVETGGAGMAGDAAGGTQDPGSGGTGGSGGNEPDPPSAPGLEFEASDLPGVSNSTDFRWVPGHDDELVVLSHSGRIHHLRVTESGYESLGSSDLEGIYYDEGCGLLSFAFDPEFEENHFIYLAYCTSNRESRLTRHVFDTVSTIPDSGVEILTVATDVVPDEDWHRFGSMGFEPDGETLWVMLGDSFVMSTAQDVTDKFGSLLRLVPSRDPEEGGFTPAEGNAFESGEGDETIYAYGFRSPWRASLDAHGRYWIGDVGLVTYEEVNLATRAGQNFGWSRSEGPCTSDCDELRDPATYFGRTDEEEYDLEDPDTEPNVRRAVWVGEAYDSPSTDRYYGLHDDMLIFGDFFMGWVRGLRVNEDDEVEDDVFLGHLPRVTSFRVGPDGYMYALTLDGDLFRALPKYDE